MELARDRSGGSAENRAMMRGPDSTVGSSSHAAREELRAKVARAMPGRAVCRDHPVPDIADHELVRIIGCGGYGQVWLARSVTGTCRAVKVVYRSSFDSDRPYEREFAGIQRFEPISRLHESQVDVLHVGRNIAEGYFYYVMELADNANGAEPPKGGAPNALPRAATYPIFPENYAPRTLRSELERRGRLPFDACLEIALALTTSLEHLHKHGLIHRDIKPSNIIFVNGRPKLADIGLVTRADETCSIVGTEGYLPPEGPGAAQADLYSLGKVLYEIATGKDRRDFPALPEAHSSAEEERRFLELNAIILKACQRNPVERYESAEQIHADLLLLQAGKSVRRTHQLEQRLAVASRVGAVSLAVSVLAIAAYVWAAHQKRVATENQARAEKSETATREQLRQSLLHQARALRLSGRPGQRSEALAALGRAAEIGVGADLRSEAVRCLTLMDMRPLQRWASEITRPLIFGVNLRHNRLLEGDRQGNVIMRPLSGGDEVARVPGPDLLLGWNTLLSSDGRYLLAKYHPWGAQHINQFQIWDLSRNEARVSAPQGIQYVAFDFSPDSRFAAYASASGELVVYALASGREVVRCSLGIDAYSLSYSPDGSRLAISSLKGVVQIRNSSDGALLKAFEHPAGVRCVSWHPDGRRLVVPGDDWLIHLLDVETERRLGIFAGHKAQVINARFSHNGQWLASVSWDRTVALWDVERTQLLVTSPSARGTHFIEFSEDDTRLACYGDEFEACVMEITSPAATLFQPTGLRDSNLSMLDVSPDGELVAYSSTRGLHLRTMPRPDATRVGAAIQARRNVESRAAGPELERAVDGPTPAAEHQGADWLRGRMRGVHFFPGDRIIAGGNAGLFLWDIQRPGGTNDALQLGAPKALWSRRFFEGPDDFVVSADNRTVLCRADTNAAAVIDVRGEREPLLLQPHPLVTYVALSADARWAATASSRDKDVRIWNATNGELAKHLPGVGPARVAFSPTDGRLIINTTDGCSLYVPGTWNLVREIRREASVGEGRPQRGVVSGDGELFAVGWGGHLVRIIHLPTGEVLLDLEVLAQIPLCFGPDSDRLYVLGQYNEIYFWDLRQIRQNLAAIDLDWPSEIASQF